MTPAAMALTLADGSPVTLHRAEVITLADVADLAHRCITACCLAHCRTLYVGGTAAEWVHSDGWACGLGGAG